MYNKGMATNTIFDRFELASIKRMFKNALMVSKYSHKSFLYVLYDMSKCILKDGIGYLEYNLFHFVGKSQELRDTYVTFKESQALFKLLNDREYMDIFDNKLLFNDRFKEYIGRDFIDAAHCTDEEFINFCKNKKKIFCKPKDSCSGKGIYKNIDINEDTDILELHQFMIDNDLFCEDNIVQHPEMNKLHDKSINTIRITTVLKDNEAHVMYALLRVGIGDMKVDNVASGGIYTVLNEDGVIVNPFWSDKTISTYTKHPTNNFELLNFKIPMFKEALELCKKAALIEPHIRYVGWDVAISDKGPILVEGNQLPGYDMCQNYYVTNSDIGLLPKFEKILGKIEV